MSRFLLTVLFGCILATCSEENAGASFSAAEGLVGIPLKIAYNGWSTMDNLLEGQTTGNRESDNPSLFTMVGEMYRANGIDGYSYDFEFLAQGSDYIDSPQALRHIASTDAPVLIISAYGGSTGILQDPEQADAENGWINKMVTAVEAAVQRNIQPIMYQAWGSARAPETFGNARLNTQALLAKVQLPIVRTGEVVARLGQVNPDYVTNSRSPGGKYVPPVTHLYSGDPGDTFHGSYALAYANALATFKCLTGISAADNAFEIPSGGAAGTRYGISDGFVDDILASVDSVQQGCFDTAVQGQ